MSEDPILRPAVFLDRDGTLIEEVDHLSRVEDLRLYTYTAEAVELFRQYGFRVIVITNQSGIGRGYFEESSMQEVHDCIQTELSNGIDAFYHCPHLPTDGCKCRKPSFGMIEAACRDFAIDMTNSWMIGDKAIDVETGRNAGIRNSLVLTGYGTSQQHELSFQPDFIGNTLLDSAKRVVTGLTQIKR